MKYVHTDSVALPPGDVALSLTPQEYAMVVAVVHQALQNTWTMKNTNGEKITPEQEQALRDAAEKLDQL